MSDVMKHEWSKDQKAEQHHLNSASELDKEIEKRMAAKKAHPNKNDKGKYYKGYKKDHDKKDTFEWRRTKEEDPNAPHYKPGHDPQSAGRNAAFN